MKISIHALLAESDTIHRQFPCQNRDFYPRSPCGERLAGPSGPAFLFNFYPRSPCGERRLRALVFTNFTRISIHALLAESDRRHRGNDRSPIHFYPRSPCGERPPKVFRHCTTYLFLSTLSLRRATRSKTHDRHKTPISIHALLAESDALQS